MVVSTIVSLAHLLGILAINRGARIVTFTAHTDARLRKTGNPLPEKRATKIARVNGIVNFKYTNSVNNQREREGNDRDFVAQPRAWGKRLAGYPFVAHNGNLYLEVKIERVLDVQFEDANGEPLAREQVAPFLPARHDSGETQGVDKAIILTDYKVQNIRELTIDGERYTIDLSTVAECIDTNIAAAIS